MQRDEIFQRIETTWQEFQNALDGIPPERAAEPGVAGEWSVKDLLGHIAFWERNCASGVQHLDADEVVEQLSTDELNAQEQERNKDRPYEELHGEFIQTHAELMNVLRATEALDPGVLEFDTWEHYQQHSADIRNWREREGL